MRNVSTLRRAMPRMEWSPKNLYMLWRRSLGPDKFSTNFQRTRETMFQQRWKSKALVRAYHGDYINEKIFKRWYLPTMLPDVRPRRPAGDDAELLARFAQREVSRQAEERKKGMAPVGSLMFAEVERRIDVFLFRSCFAHSVYEARRLVIHGSVMLNGQKHRNANTRLAPGDMVSVDPKAIRFIQPPEENTPAEEDAETSDVEAASDVEGEASSSTQLAVSKVPAISPHIPVPKDIENLTPFRLPEFAAPFIFIPAYIEVSFPTCSAIYVRHPTARPGYSEIPTPYDADGEVVRLSWEWYAKRRTRIRSARQKAREPENRKAPWENKIPDETDVKRYNQRYGLPAP